jgi:hypothetical protein
MILGEIWVRLGAFEGVVGVDTICRLKCWAMHALQTMHIDSAKGLIIIKTKRVKKSFSSLKWKILGMLLEDYKRYERVKYIIE